MVPGGWDGTCRPWLEIRPQTLHMGMSLPPSPELLLMQIGVKDMVQSVGYILCGNPGLDPQQCLPSQGKLLALSTAMCDLKENKTKQRVYMNIYDCFPLCP